MINYGEDSIRMRKTAMTHHQFSNEYLELPPTDVPEAPGLQLNFDWTNIKRTKLFLKLQRAVKQTVHPDNFPSF